MIHKHSLHVGIVASAVRRVPNTGFFTQTNIIWRSAAEENSSAINRLQSNACLRCRLLAKSIIDSSEFVTVGTSDLKEDI